MWVKLMRPTRPRSLLFLLDIGDELTQLSGCFASKLASAACLARYKACDSRNCKLESSGARDLPLGRHLAIATTGVVATGIVNLTRPYCTANVVIGSLA